MHLLLGSLKLDLFYFILFTITNVVLYNPLIFCIPTYKVNHLPTSYLSIKNENKCINVFFQFVVLTFITFILFLGPEAVSHRPSHPLTHPSPP